MMAKKIDVKLLLELRQANMSQRAIASTRHISTKSVAAVWRRADELGISLADVTDKTSDEVYTLFFPEKFRKETMYASVDYEYVHNELKKSGVTLKLLWQMPLTRIRCILYTSLSRRFRTASLRMSNLA